MKVRSNYVSNSSSSSFIIYGRTSSTFEDIEEWLNEGKDAYIILRDGGFSGDCADLVVKMTPKRYSLLRPYFYKLDDCDIVCADFTCSEGTPVSTGRLDGGVFFIYNMDYSSPSTDDDDDEDFDRLMEDVKRRHPFA